MNKHNIDNLPIKQITTDFYTTYEIEPIDIIYRVVADMKQAYLKLRPDFNDEDVRNKELIDEYNGVMVPPRNIGEDFNVLLNKRIISSYLKQDNKAWVGTIIHETTHALDFIEFAELTRANNYDRFEESDEHHNFLLWTEFNARAKGHYFYRKYQYKNMFDRSLMFRTRTYELPQLKQNTQADMSKATSDYKKAYYAVNLLGRLYTLQSIYPKYFDKQVIQSTLSDCMWMYEWYVFLSTHATLETAYPEFAAMEKILSKGGLNFKI